jgi:hypothetical protein
LHVIFFFFAFAILFSQTRHDFSLLPCRPASCSVIVAVRNLDLSLIRDDIHPTSRIVRVRIVRIGLPVIPPLLFVVIVAFLAIATFSFFGKVFFK